MKELNGHALGMSVAALLALWMLVMGIAASMGYYLQAWEWMMMFHVWADLSAVGIIIGMIEAAVCGYIDARIVAWIYNRLA